MTRRLLMTTDAVGGVWSYSTDLAAELCASGVTVALVVQGPPPSSAQLAPLQGVPGLHVIVTQLALEWLDPEGADIPRARQTLQAIARDFKPDLVHLNGYREALHAFEAPVLVVAHSCVWSWWAACRDDTPGESRWRTYRVNVAAGLAAAQAWVAPSASFAHSMARIYRPPGKAVVVHNGCSRPVASARKEASILAAGRFWDEGKNIAALARVAPRLAWPVRVAGVLDSPSDTGGTAGPASVDFIGNLSRPELAAEMARAGIFVSLARYEPFGLAVLEAAAHGCALVLSAIPTLRELWDGAAVFVDPSDSEAVCRGINALCHDPARRAELQDKARARAAQYSLRQQVHAYEWLYATMHRRKSAPRIAPIMEVCA